MSNKVKILQLEEVAKEHNAVDINQTLNEMVVTCADMCRHMEEEKNFPLRKFEATDANAAFYIFIHYATLIVTQRSGDMKKFSKAFNKLMKDFIA